MPGGAYYRSYDGVDYTDMGNPATVSSFRLDTFEITVGRFRKFVDAAMGTQASPPAAGAGAHPLIAGSGWDAAWNPSLAANTTALAEALACHPTYATWTDQADENENRAVNCISWYEAFAFCAWDGGSLPTEAEWNYAAAGGSEQRVFPWSNPPADVSLDCTHANYSGCPPSDVNLVGATPNGDGRWGQTDLGGNVWEWILDEYELAYNNPCSDCANLSFELDRIIRGGAFNYDATGLRAAFRGAGSPATRYHYVGVRCVRTPWFYPADGTNQGDGTVMKVAK